LGLELSNATASICEIFALLFCDAHNPKVVSSNLTPATIRAGKTKGPPEMLPGGRCSILVQIVREMSVFSLAKNEMTMELIRLRRVPN